LEKAKVIRPYLPLFGSSRASAVLHILSRKKSVKRNSGLYKVGHGEKSIIWYWEFDVEKRYFHQFKTIDYVAAVRYYKANRFTMWEEGKSTMRLLNDLSKSLKELVEGDAEDNQEDGEGEGDGDFHEHAAEHEHEEQREAKTDVQGQNDGQNVRDDSGNSKDNGNRQDNEEERRANPEIVHSSQTLNWS